jgi:hypothetical protein
MSAIHGVEGLIKWIKGDEWRNDFEARAPDATFQERSLRAEIPLSPRRRLQYFQPPTPSHVRSITPRATHRGDEYVARGRRGRLKIAVAWSAHTLRMAT